MLIAATPARPRTMRRALSIVGPAAAGLKAEVFHPPGPRPVRRVAPRPD